MKKRFLCAALALSLIAHFASAEAGAFLHAGNGAVIAPIGLESFSNPSVERMQHSELGEGAGLLLGMLAIASDSTFISLNFPFPFQYENFDIADYGADGGWTWGWGIGWDATFFFTQWVGFHLSLDMYIPIASLGNGRGTDVSESGFSYSFFAGPSFPVAVTDRILFAVSPGVHFEAIDGTLTSYPFWHFLFGLGASAELNVILSKLFFIRAGLDVTYDFVGIELLKGYGDSGRRNFKALNIVPSVGVGLWL